MSKKQLDTELILIYWKQRHWKSMFATILACDRISRLYWNVAIKFNWFDVVHKINHHLQFETDFKIGSYSRPWYIIVDEIWKNFNSKKAMTKKNEVFSDFIFLQWKYDLSTIWIAQRWSSIPIDLKELATQIFEIKKINRSWTYPVFKIIRKELLDDMETLEFISEETFDMIWFLNKINVTYDTLETSIIK
jgi:hypothetical protein